MTLHMAPYRMTLKTISSNGKAETKRLKTNTVQDQCHGKLMRDTLQRSLSFSTTHRTSYSTHIITCETHDNMFYMALQRPIDRRFLATIKLKRSTKLVSELRLTLLKCCKMCDEINGTLQLHCRFCYSQMLCRRRLSSVTRVYYDKIAEARNMQFSCLLYTSPSPRDQA